MTATVPVSKSLKQKLKQVCNELKEYRRSQGISASHLAKKASITRVTLNKLEQGDNGVSVGVWLKVLSVLESTDKFFGLLSSAVTKSNLSSKKTVSKNMIRSSQPKSKSKKITSTKTSVKKVSKVKPVVKTKVKTTTRTRTKTKTKVRSKK